MAMANINPDTICYSSAIHACSVGNRWKESLLLISNMKSNNVPVDIIVCNSAIAACGSSGWCT